MSLQIALHKEYPPIFGTDKTGKTRVWKATIFLDKTNSSARAVIQHGIYGGKLQIDTREYKEGKNLGKKNETTALEQCVSETEKKRRDKIEKESYVETFPNSLNASLINDTDRKIFPMLANKYEPNSTSTKKNSIVYPCFVQPKLDGLRCVVYLNKERQVVYQSRTGGYFTTLAHLDEYVKPILERQEGGFILDGELYTIQMPFEELAGIIKKKTLSEEDKEKIKLVQYHTYDIVLPNKPFRERFALLRTCLSDSCPSVCLVPTYIANSVVEFKKMFGEFVKSGYEGIMLRNMEGLYKENYRSNDLLKYKEFLEAEYQIVDFREATGRDAGTVIWECITPEGRRFSVRPRGTVETRTKWFENAKSYVGKQLTVIYQELSEMNIPRFPVGKAIREDY